jgi:hypothetical protein
MREKRKSPRHRVKEWAKIIFDDGRTVRNCTITDISAGGARLCIGNAALPTSFYLYRKSAGCLREVTVMNLMSQIIGVRFESEPLDLTSEKARSLLTSIARGSGRARGEAAPASSRLRLARADAFLPRSPR